MARQEDIDESVEGENMAEEGQRGASKKNKGKEMNIGCVSVIGLVALVVLVVFFPFERQEGEFSKLLRGFARGQEEYSEEFTDKLVAPVEDDLVGEDKGEADGDNWSIPNILRHLFGLDRD